MASALKLLPVYGHVRASFPYRQCSWSYLIPFPNSGYKLSLSISPQLPLHFWHPLPIFAWLKLSLALVGISLVPYQREVWDLGETVPAICLHFGLRWRLFLCQGFSCALSFVHSPCTPAVQMFTDSTWDTWCNLSHSCCGHTGSKHFPQQPEPNLEDQTSLFLIYYINTM